MSCGRAIDGDEPLFDFDGLDSVANDEQTSPSPGPSSMAPGLLDMSHIPPLSKLDLSSYSGASTPAEVVAYISRVQEQNGYMSYGHNPLVNGEGLTGGLKGKAASRPVDIIAPSTSAGAGRDADFDPYCTSGSPLPTNSGALARRRQSSLSTTSPQTFDSFDFSLDGASCSFSTSLTTAITTPGTSFEDDRIGLATDDESGEENHGKGKSRAAPILPPLSFSPTSFGHGETSWPLSSPSSPVAPGPSFVPSGISHQRPSAAQERTTSRPRSFSSVSSRSTKSTFSALRNKLSRGKRSSSALRNLLTKELANYDLDKEESAPANTPNGIIHPEQFSSFSAPATPYEHHAFRNSVSACEDISGFVTTERVETRRYFEDMLPREIKLKIMRKLLELHKAEAEDKKDSDLWTARTALDTEHRWMGIESGLAELVRYSRVSKSWQQLVFDGQLWSTFDLRAFPMAHNGFLCRLAQFSGSFVSSIDLTGHTTLTAKSLLDITTAFCINSSNALTFSFPTTQLTCINLFGCTHISTFSLNNLLSHSPRLVKLNIKGLLSATDETCKTLSRHCLSLQFLNLSYCYNVNLDGASSLMKPWETSNKSSPLRGLRIAGLSRINGHFMSLLGRYAPDLEILDLSGIRGLQNSELAAYVSCEGIEDSDNGNSILLTSREAGRDPGDPTKYRRRVTKLRHLILSQCPLLSDIACSNLAFALPKLEFLELAGIGSELKDEGLIRLLRTTPLLRRLDLDEASGITDATITALTPSTDEQQQSTVATGMRLEQLNLSYAVQLTSDALHLLARACPNLKHLELDSTRVSGLMVKEFVRQARRRETVGAQIVVVDCRGVGENAVKDLADDTRTRRGWRGWDARFLKYLDSRDNEGLGVGTDECDDKRVVLKSFYSWQAVDAVEAAREKQRKSGRSRVGEDYFSTKRNGKWWAPGARRPPLTTYRDSRDSCIIM